MKQIHVVGAGALGSTFCHEMTKRLYALEIPGVQLYIYDFDKVDASRNTTAQMFSASDDGQPKAVVVANAITPTLKAALCGCVPCVTRVRDTGDLYDPFCDHDTIVVDMVDNYKTRLLLDGAENNYPVLHAGMSQEGGGFVGWSYKGRTTWNMALDNMNPQLAMKLLSAKEEDEVKMPPCVLTSLRGLIWNTSFAAVEAISIFMGKDPFGHVRTPEGGKYEEPGIMASWATSPLGFSLLSDITMYPEEAVC
jgi:hypothetical protein